MRKLGRLLSAVVPFLIALGIQLVVSTILVVAYGFVVAFQKVASGEMDANEIAGLITDSLNSNVLLGISAFTALICLVVFGLWYRKLVKNSEKITYEKLFSVKTIGLLVLLGVGLQISISIILTLISAVKPEWFDYYSELMESLGMGNSLLSVVYVGLIGPISEELIFRGVILNKAKKVMPFAAANIFQALCFGIYHMNLIQGIYAFVIGAFFGYICYRFKTVFGSMLLHMIINISGMFLDNILTDKVLSNVIIVILLLIASVVTVILSTLAMKKESGHMEDDGIYLE